MGDRTRIPEPTRIKDPEIRSWANELIRWLNVAETPVDNTSVTAGQNITLSVTPTGMIEINALLSAGGGYLTEASASAAYLTKVSSSAFVKVPEVCAVVEGYGYLISADISEYITSQELSAYKFLTSASAESRFLVSALTTAQVSSYDYITSQEASALIIAIGGGTGLTSANVCAMLSAYIPSNPVGTSGALRVYNIISLTSAQYASITPASATLYIVVD